jgi:hypothetical protein
MDFVVLSAGEEVDPACQYFCNSAKRFSKPQKPGQNAIKFAATLLVRDMRFLMSTAAARASKPKVFFLSFPVLLAGRFSAPKTGRC